MGGPYRTSGEKPHAQLGGDEAKPRDWIAIASSANLVLVQPEHVSGGVEHVRLNAHRVVAVSQDSDNVGSFAFVCWPGGPVSTNGIFSANPMVTL